MVTQLLPDVFCDEKFGRSFCEVRFEISDKELNTAERMALVPGLLPQTQIVTGGRSAVR